MSRDRRSREAVNPVSATQSAEIASNYKAGDKAYWERYYAERRKPFAPSLFACHVFRHYVQPGHTLIEVGCGNGRDAIYFAQQGVRVTAVDQCEDEILFLSKAYALENLEYVSHDFTDLDTTLNYDHVYSRFTMHSISRAKQATVLRWARGALEMGGYFLLEARGKRNELYGKGEPVPGEPDAFIHGGHYRRFLDFEETCLLFENQGFEVREALEGKGCAPFEGVDETFVRIFARKSSS